MARNFEPRLRALKPVSARTGRLVVRPWHFSARFIQEGKPMESIAVKSLAYDFEQEVQPHLNRLALLADLLDGQDMIFDGAMFGTESGAALQGILQGAVTALKGFQELMESMKAGQGVPVDI